MFFNNESEMQRWLESELEEHRGLLSIIDNENEIRNFEAKSMAEKKIQDSFTLCLDNLENLHVISADKNISVDKDDKLRPDIVAYSMIETHWL